MAREKLFGRYYLNRNLYGTMLGGTYVNGYEVWDLSCRDNVVERFSNTPLGWFRAKKLASVLNAESGEKKPWSEWIATWEDIWEYLKRTRCKE